MQMMKGVYGLAAAVLMLLVVLSSCRRISFVDDGDALLAFSSDTLKFDTVFTTVGSATRSFKIYNTYNQSLKVSSISLAGGEGSMFRMNVDGISGSSIGTLEIPPNDSLYVFVEVTIDPNSDALPYVVEDSIRFVTNNNEQYVQLVAWGQNANFIDGQIICDEVWENDLPYVIYNSILVDTLCTLTIREGCRIYMHGGSSFFVLGSIIVEGEADSLVRFQGDRLESFFEDIPGQWEGISLLRGSSGHTIRYAEIKNANYGILAGLQSTNPELSSYLGTVSRPDLEISNSYIYDCQLNGLFAVNAEVDATNLLIYNIGENNVVLSSGGDYTFRHCTLANYGSSFLSHQSPILSISDFIQFGDVVIVNDLEGAQFTNSIIWGNIVEGKEVAVSNDGEAPVFNYQFDHCVVRTDLSGPEFVDCQINIDPLFAAIGERNYCPEEISNALNAGIDIGVPDDIVGTPRPFAGTLPDIGCYETYVE